jgi:flagellar hook-basal body complex protein FliE
MEPLRFRPSLEAIAARGADMVRSVRDLEGPSGIGSGIAPETTVGDIAGPSFGDVLAQTVGEAAALGRSAEAQAQALASGASDDLHGTMIALKEAEISMKLVGQIRSKVLDAFHELWRTNV